MKTPSSPPALCQCVSCYKYLANNRPSDDGTGADHNCIECGGNKPLATIRGTLTEPLSIECLALLSEECAEIQQRVGKIMRWGWDADFEGTTQKDKLESEIGDILAAISIMLENNQIVIPGIYEAMNNKLDKLKEDADGPRQRLLHAKIPGKFNGGGYYSPWITFLK